MRSPARSVLLFALLGACDPAPAPPASGAPAILRLLPLLPTATLQTAPLVLPPGAAADGSFTLSSGWSQLPGTRVWSHESPVRLAHGHYREKPSGMTLMNAAGRAHPWVNATAERGAVIGGWEYIEGVIYLASTRDPGQDPPIVQSSAAAEALARLDPARAGLPPADWARHTTTLGDMTRDSLLLTGGAAATFPLTLPAQSPRLRFGHGMVDPGVAGFQGEARLTVSINGDEVFAAPLKEALFTEAAVDLSHWSGQTVSLTFALDPQGDPTGDLAAIGTPEVDAAGATAAQARRIVLIGLDTLRPDHLSANGYTRPTSPHLDALAGQSTVFSQAWTVAPRTRPAFRSVLTGRWPLPALSAPTLGEAFANAGWSTAGFVANVHLIPRLGFADGFGWWEYVDSVSATHQVDRTLSWLDAHAAEDSLVFVHFMDPHVFYMPPDPYKDQFTHGLSVPALPERYNRWLIRKMEAEGRLSDEAKTLMEARYDGELAYLDAELGRLVAAIDQLPGQTTIAFVSDHGEEFWDHGEFEHNHSLYEELVRSMLWIRRPDHQGQAIAAPTSIVDLAPTLVSLAGLPPLPEVDGHDLTPFLTGQGAEALAAASAARPLPLGHMMFAKERWGVVFAGQKYILHTISGQEERYDLVADPREQTNLTTDLGPARAALAAATGWPVGPGWRVHLRGAKEPFTLRFEAPVQAALLDPEAGQDRRANLEWGEIPPIKPSDVGRLELLDGGQTLRFTPGQLGRGTLALLGLEPAAKVTVEEVNGRHALSPGRGALGGGPVEVVPGTIILPQDNEARRLAAAADGDALQALRALGYVE